MASRGATTGRGRTKAAASARLAGAGESASSARAAGGRTASPEIQVLRLAQISAPKYDFTIRRETTVERLRDRLESGSQIPPVMVARLGSRYYPFAAFASLEAYKALAMDVPCHVHVVSSQKDILELHVAREQKETMHPIRFLDGVRELHDQSGDMTVVPEEYQSFGSRPILLTATARKMLDAFLVKVGEQFDLGGEWTHVIETISRLKDSVQDRAVTEIISYVQGQKRPIPPDMFSLRRIVDAYSADKMQQVYSDDDGYGVDADDDDDEEDGAGSGYGSGGEGSPGPAGGKKGKKGKNGKAGPGGRNGASSVIVSSGSDGEMPLVMSPMPGTLMHACDCGKEYYLSSKNMTLRRLEPTDENVQTLRGDYGRPVYAIPQDGSEFLELVMQPTLHFYYVGGEKTEDGERGHTMIMTKRHVSKAGLAAIRRIIEGTSKDGSKPSSAGGGNGRGGNGGRNGKGSGRRR